jgi:hypothetical protein
MQEVVITRDDEGNVIECAIGYCIDVNPTAEQL